MANVGRSSALRENPRFGFPLLPWPPEDNHLSEQLDRPRLEAAACTSGAQITTNNINTLARGVMERVGRRM